MRCICPLLLLFCSILGFFFVQVYAAFLDAGLLTREVTQVVQLGAAHLAVFVNLDAVNVRRIERENTFYAYRTRHFANREASLVAVSRDADHYAAEHLDTFFVSFNNFVSHADGVARTEVGKLRCLVECLLGNFD